MTGAQASSRALLRQCNREGCAPVNWNPSADADGTDHHDGEPKVEVKTWIKRLGFWGFLFFLVKGLLWLAIPALIALWATE